MIIRCLIVEDEPLSAEVLQKYTGELDFIEISGVCQDAREALKALGDSPIDLLFLDIRMPGLTGFEFLRTLEKPPLVIVITAYPEYAVEGFEMDVLDYLVKPVSFERFLKAVNRARIKIESTRATVGREDACILVRADKKIHRVPLNQIESLESEGDYVRIFTTNARLTTHDTLRNMESQLPDNIFIRIHRRYIVSLRHIKYIEGNMVQAGERRLPVSESYRQLLLQKMENSGSI